MLPPAQFIPVHSQFFGDWAAEQCPDEEPNEIISPKPCTTREKLLLHPRAAPHPEQSKKEAEKQQLLSPEQSPSLTRQIQQPGCQQDEDGEFLHLMEQLLSHPKEEYPGWKQLPAPQPGEFAAGSEGQRVGLLYKS